MYGLEFFELFFELAERTFPAVMTLSAKERFFAPVDPDSVK
jgi:hypothetical protein